jgi:large subunit ribosomal protein L17
MRHRKAGKELGRNPSHRRAMLRNMVTSLLKYEQIETTDAKAKALRPVAEKMITLAKRGDLHARRQALAYIQDKETTHRLFGDLKDRYLQRQGGYVRIIKKGVRKGDGAAVSIIQLLPVEEGKKSGKRKVKKPKTQKASSGKAGGVTAGNEKKEESKPEHSKADKKEEKK